MKTYQMNGGWYLPVPDNWTAEVDGVDGHDLFYPPDSDLTLHFTPFQAEGEGGQPAPVPPEVMIGAFLQGIPEGAAEMDKLACHLENFSVKGFAFLEKERGQKVYRRLIGYYGPGELLSAGIFGTSEKECDEAVRMLRGLGR